MIKYQIKIGVLLGLILSIPLSATAATVLENIQKTGVVKVAIREDAAPFGYTDTTGNLQGYCLDFFSLLEKKLINQLKRNTLIFRVLKSRVDNRFDLVTEGFVQLECGPNTIRSQLQEQVVFSQPFFMTGTQFLIRQSNNNLFNLDTNLNQLRLGVIEATSTEKYLRDRYPQAQLTLFRGVTARSRGVQALAQGKIDAMVSDGILLRAEAQQQNLSLANYSLIPEQPLTCDSYGMLLPQGDRSWQDFVNSVITSPESKELLNKWFGDIIPYTQITEANCQNNSEF
ncbi:amino acid ABC transporter substrate-binding protein, PAAT family [Stanieria cyanosphaera PCC 7437]|uniref:Amino acid ABC transporter substrate-binding protein, PAAT family n=1 Tax=Stanieria cyanosphaera (strain ATCC 29371 / PCC 7437) TaxID=111780 RepID=K9XZR6_STAC7|nr:amino acid ABC transporter substrate-binding protein [Stanieria cyanosphaera]AFZ37167.1 amino acid ABC transporter substrate-binding protein, PAAT family [Stanieria cyanosphaera PCC 7437]